MRVLIKTKEQLLASGWVDFGYNLINDRYATITKTMQQYLGKYVDVEGTMGSNHVYAKGYTWGLGAIMTKKDIINEFFK